MDRWIDPLPLAAVAALLLAGCADGAPGTVREEDPALAAALGEPIMADPDLVSLNRANSAAAMPPLGGLLPTLDGGPAAIAAARADALRLVGGLAAMERAPDPRDAPGTLPADAALAVAARAAASGIDRACAERARYTALWATRMPRAFPVYPRGAVQEAAGTDVAGCALRAVNFVTPVPVGDVIDFYFTRARAAGFSVGRELRDGDDVLSGVRGKASYAVHARRLPTGHTEVELVTTG